MFNSRAPNRQIKDAVKISFDRQFFQEQSKTFKSHGIKFTNETLIDSSTLNFRHLLLRGSNNKHPKQDFELWHFQILIERRSHKFAGDAIWCYTNSCWGAHFCFCDQSDSGQNWNSFRNDV